MVNKCNVLQNPVLSEALPIQSVSGTSSIDVLCTVSAQLPAGIGEHGPNRATAKIRHYSSNDMIVMINKQNVITS